MLRGETKPPDDRDDLELLGHAPVSSAQEGDRQVLAQLVAGGRDLNGPRHTLHFLYFPSEEIADSAARSLSEAGYSAGTYLRLELGRENEWPVIAEVNDLLNEEVLQREREFLTAFAENLGGEYDGFEAAVG